MIGQTMVWTIQIKRKKMQKLLFLFLVIGIAPVALADNQMSLREKIYSYASQGDLIKLKNLQKSGYSLDMPDSKGQQAVCEEEIKKGSRLAAFHFVSTLGFGPRTPTMSR